MVFCRVYGMQFMEESHRSIHDSLMIVKRCLKNREVRKPLCIFMLSPLPLSGCSFLGAFTRAARALSLSWEAPNGDKIPFEVYFTV